MARQETVLCLCVAIVCTLASNGLLLGLLLERWRRLTTVQALILHCALADVPYSLE